MSHNHSHDHGGLPEIRLRWAVAVNILLTAVQVIAGILSGSLALIADAIHNFSDAAALLIALVAIRIGRKQADHKRTFGYKRVETLAAFVNLGTLLFLGAYLVFEAIRRFFDPVPVEGWAVVIVAGIALVIDVATAILVSKGAKSSLNIRAAYLHNIADALSSVGVMVAGAIIILYGWPIADSIATFVIASYVLFHAGREIPAVLNILLNGAPEGVSLDAVTGAIEDIDGVKSVHHVHLWRIDEKRNALEAHVVVEHMDQTGRLKTAIKNLLVTQFALDHVTLEFESVDCGDHCDHHHP